MKQIVYGALEVHCSGSIESDCDFKKTDENDKTQCYYNHEMVCLNNKVFEILLKNMSI